MKAQCLPFSQIPHTTQLFSDFLYDFPKVQQFYSRAPHIQEWLKDETAAVRYDPGRRARVSAILERQNKSWSASPKTIENIARLRAGAAALVTGQQVGLFGGPLFSIFKALSAIKVAVEATAAGVECVPVFWLATEDHDLDEVNHASIPAADGSLVKLIAPAQGPSDAPVSTVSFAPEIESIVKTASELLGDGGATNFLRETYRTGETMGRAFARLFTRLFGDWGVILLDASDEELHAVAEPIFRAAGERAAELDDALLERGKALEAAGYHQQVKVTPSSTLLFTLRHGSRVPVHRRPNGGSGSNEFVVGDEKLSQAELLQHIAGSPEEFSPNVLLRPVVQDYLLPTLAYIGGAAEVAYFAQAAVVYQALLGRITPILPRFSATIVESKAQRLLERYHLAFPEVFIGPDRLRENLAARILPDELQAAFDNANSSVEKSIKTVRESLARLDQSLVEAAENAASKMQYQLQQLRARAARAELRHSETAGRHAEFLSNMLYPEKALQEREIAGIYFVARYGTELLQNLYETVHTSCHDHQIISL